MQNTLDDHVNFPAGLLSLTDRSLWNDANLTVPTNLLIKGNMQPGEKYGATLDFQRNRDIFVLDNRGPANVPTPKLQFENMELINLPIGSGFQEERWTGRSLGSLQY